MSERKVAKQKIEALSRFASLAEKYNVIAIADLHKVRSSQIQELRKKLRGTAEMFAIKNTIARKAAEEIADKKRNIIDFVKRLTGPNLLLFTNMNPYSLILFLNRNKVKVSAKGGDIATNDIVIPAGNTGIPPGPIISEFGAVKVPTKIEGGSIWIVKDTIVARKGETISSRLASLLSKLGMKPIEVGLSITGAYDGGQLLGRDELMIDVDEYRRQVAASFIQAFQLALEVGYVTAETAVPLIEECHREAVSLSIEAEFPTSETIEEIVRQAHYEAMLLSSAVRQVSEKAAPKEPSAQS
jgi:large subunit ribosomal protein L10